MPIKAPVTKRLLTTRARSRAAGIPAIRITQKVCPAAGTDVTPWASATNHSSLLASTHESTGRKRKPAGQADSLSYRKANWLPRLRVRLSANVLCK